MYLVESAFRRYLQRTSREEADLLQTKEDMDNMSWGDRGGKRKGSNSSIRLNCSDDA